MKLSTDRDDAKRRIILLVTDGEKIYGEIVTRYNNVRKRGSFSVQQHLPELTSLYQRWCKQATDELEKIFPTQRERSKFMSAEARIGDQHGVNIQVQGLLNATMGKMDLLHTLVDAVDTYESESTPESVGHETPAESTEIILCRECCRHTKHRHLFHTSQQVSSAPDDIDGGSFALGVVYWDLFQCQGCETITCRRKEETPGGDPMSVSLYPPFFERRLPDWISSVPSEIRDMVREVYSALTTDLRRVANMGARAAIDMVIDDQVGDQGTFKRGLDALEEKGLVSKKDKEVILAAVDSGHASAHRGHRPSANDLKAVLDIVENMLQKTYDLGRAADRLKQSTPPRSKKSKSDGQN